MIKKRKYLYRLAVSIFSILLAPMIIFAVFFWKQSYRELLDSNDVYYEEVINSYKMVLDKKITDMKQYATNISVQSKKSDNLFFRRANAAPYENYWYYNAMLELSERYNTYGREGIGLYYYDADTVIKASGAMTLEQYVKQLASEKSGEVAEFFSEDMYEEQKVQLLVLNDMDLLLGVHVNMGYLHEKAMVFYQITEAAMVEELGAAYEGSGFICYLRDGNGNICFLGEREADTEDVVRLAEGGYEFYSLGACLSEEAPQNRAAIFYDEMGFVLFMVTLVMLASYVVILYIAYKPIYNVTSRLDFSDVDEFEAIGRELDNQDAKIVEQEMMILDFLLNHLLYGIPIPEERLKHLGVTEQTKYYCVFFVEGYVPTNAQEKRLASLVREECHAKLFVTDWQEKKQSIYIAFMEEDNAGQVRKLIADLCGQNAVPENALYSGKTVNELNSISESLQQCFKEMKGKANDVKTDDKSKAQKQEKLKQDIQEYVEQHYREADLSQERLADYFAISTYTLSRMFRKQMGVGFVEYVNAKRVEYAKEQLLVTARTVHEIAIESGFSSDNNFFKVFKAYTGVSPSVFREQ